MQRLPSPSSLNKGGINKAPKPIKIMTAITEEKDGDDEDKFGFGKKRASKSAEGGSRAKANFTMKELMHLNRAPKYQYLKKSPDRSS